MSWKLQISKTISETKTKVKRKFRVELIWTGGEVGDLGIGEKIEICEICDVPKISALKFKNLSCSDP